MTTQSEEAWKALTTAMDRHQQSTPDDKSLERFVDSLKEDEPEIYEELRELLTDFWVLCNTTSDTMSTEEP